MTEMPLLGVVMKKFMMAVGVTAVFSFAQFGGFGGPQGGGSVPNTDKTADVNYVGDGKGYHTLDIYIPKEAKESYPVVIHTYGSAWSSNNMKGSADLSTICAAYAKAGYAVVTPNHRAASDGIYPAQLHDIKAVVRFVRGNAAKYKFDTNFVAVSGFSSGGHLSSLTATTCGLKEGKSGSVTVDLVGDLGEFTSFSSCVDGAVLWSPPTDIYTMNPISMGGSGTMEGAFIGVERQGNKDKWMVKVSGGSHGGDKMNSTENLNKAVEFLNKAREAKKAAAKPADTTAVTDTTKKDSAVVDTSKKDTTVRDTTVKDTSTGFVPRLEKSYDLEIHGNRLFALGAPETLRYTIIAVNGSRKFSGVFRKELDLSALPPGIYGIMVDSPSGVMNIIRFVRK